MFAFDADLAHKGKLGTMSKASLPKFLNLGSWALHSEAKRFNNRKRTVQYTQVVIDLYNLESLRISWSPNVFLSAASFNRWLSYRIDIFRNKNQKIGQRAAYREADAGEEPVDVMAKRGRFDMLEAGKKDKSVIGDEY